MAKFSTVCARFKSGPLGVLNRFCEIMLGRFQRFPVCRRFFLAFNDMLWKIHGALDRPFDKKYGINTSGVIYFQDLQSDLESFRCATRYEATSVKVFKQMIRDLNVAADQFEFVDFGSGKGRVLILAAECGFKKIVGVEFLEALHSIAVKNISAYERFTGGKSSIESIRTDAVEFRIPQGPVFLFFFSPFTGNLLQRVFDNIAAALNSKPREFFLVFYGNNKESIAAFQSISLQPGISCAELNLRPDWSQFNQYRCLYFTNVKGAVDKA